MEIDDDNKQILSQLDSVGDFHAQVQYILQHVRLTRDEVQNLTSLFDDLEHTLQTIWPGCQVFPFGSIITGLGIRTSDVDCYVDIPGCFRIPGQNYVMRAKRALMRRNSVFQNLFAISHAKVPIVKFYHEPTQRHCDVNFKSPSGVRNSKLIGYLLHMDSRVLPLAVLIKYWSKVHKLTGTNLIPNYSLTLLVIFYLQQKNILPPISLLQRSTEVYIVDHWNTAYDESFNHASLNNEDLYQLLGGFFQFYSTFNFEENIVSTFLGRPILRATYLKLEDVPEEFVLYKENVRMSVCQPLKVDSRICVQDIFDHSRNCSVAVYPNLALKLVSYLKFGAEMYEESPSESFLREILLKTPTTQQRNQKRKRIDKVEKHNKPNVNYKNMKRNLHSIYYQMNRLRKGNL